MNTNKASPHGTNRMTAAIVGVLFIIGTVPALLSLPLMQNTVSAPDHLTAISTNAGQMIVFTAINSSWVLPVPVLALRCIRYLRELQRAWRSARLASGLSRE